MSCSAYNCKNRAGGPSRKRCFRFPTNKERRKLWIMNCRRDNWIPGPGARLCEVHFEESQFEANREDGWKKLKPTAIPTLFDVPNSSQRTISSSKKGRNSAEAYISSHDLLQVNLVEVNDPEAIVSCNAVTDLTNVISSDMDLCEVNAFCNNSEELVNSSDSDDHGVNILWNISEFNANSPELDLPHLNMPCKTSQENYADVIKRRDTFISCSHPNKECLSVQKHDQENHNEFLFCYLKGSMEFCYKGEKEHQKLYM